MCWEKKEGGRKRERKEVGKGGGGRKGRRERGKERGRKKQGDGGGEREKERNRAQIIASVLGQNIDNGAE